MTIFLSSSLLLFLDPGSEVYIPDPQLDHSFFPEKIISRLCPFFTLGWLFLLEYLLVGSVVLQY